MKNLFLTITLIFVFAGIVQGQNSPYGAGEQVSYVIHYGPINGGIANMTLTEEIYEGKTVLHSYFIGCTTGIADAVFKVRDIYESYFLPESGLPVKSVRNIQEGRYRRYNVVLFDHDTRTDSSILISDLTGKHITQKGIHDILSCFYHFRKNYLARGYAFKKGEAITINTWFTDEFYPIILKFVEIEDVRTRLGKIKCYKFNPVTEVGRLFKTNEDVSIWFSADKNCIPIKIRFDIFVGAFTAEITSYEGLAETLQFINK
jgi:hypothetical protein